MYPYISVVDIEKAVKNQKNNKAAGDDVIINGYLKNSFQTSVLNTRLNNFTDVYQIICENQSGFRNGCSTTDNVFVIYISFSLMKRKKMYCAFIDFTKASDIVWKKWIVSEIALQRNNGKMYTVIFSYSYRSIKWSII